MASLKRLSVSLRACSLPHEPHPCTNTHDTHVQVFHTTASNFQGASGAAECAGAARVGGGGARARACVRACAESGAKIFRMRRRAGQPAGREVAARAALAHAPKPLPARLSLLPHPPVPPAQSPPRARLLPGLLPAVPTHLPTPSASSPFARSGGSKLAAGRSAARTPTVPSRRPPSVSPGGWVPPLPVPGRWPSRDTRRLRGWKRASPPASQPGEEAAEEAGETSPRTGGGRV